MTVKFLLLYISVLLFFNCASQGIASGGPADTEGPILISVQPPNETLEILPDQKIILLFNELLDPVSIPAAITLAEDYKVKVKSRRIIIIPDNTWPENKMLNIKFSRKIRDYQNNIMAEPIQLAYSTGAHIPNGNISGTIAGHFPGKLIEVGLYTWPVHDSSIAIQKIEADENGLFKFDFIDYGKYTLVAIETVLFDFGKQIQRKNYAMISSDYISLTPEDRAQHVNMLLSNPLERLKITSVEMEGQYRTSLIMNDQSEETFIIDTLNAPGDSVIINMVKYNRLETYALPEYAFILPEITDTTGPNYESYEFSPEGLRLTLSEPVRLAPGAVVTKQDTQDISLHFKMQNSFTVILPNLADSITHIKLLGDYIQDWHGNMMADSVKKFYIKQPKKEEEIIVGGNILGTVKYAGREPLMVEAHDIKNDKVYITQVKKRKFKLENLQAGMYKLWAFESLHAVNPETYFSGTWTPYSRASRFVLYPDSVDVRARWDVEGIVIDLE
jgi:hypothetical protein